MAKATAAAARSSAVNNEAAAPRALQADAEQRGWLDRGGRRLLAECQWQRRPRRRRLPVLSTAAAPVRGACGQRPTGHASARPPPPSPPAAGARRRRPCVPVPRARSCAARRPRAAHIVAPTAPVRLAVRGIVVLRGHYVMGWVVAALPTHPLDPRPRGWCSTAALCSARAERWRQGGEGGALDPTHPHPVFWLGTHPMTE